MVTTVEQALEWFISHPEGSVECRDANGAIKSCDSYPEAVAFLNINP
jgi:hypothetical protein